MAARQRREYLQLLDASKKAAVMSVDCFNRVHNPYRNESTLIFMANAWELLAKALLLSKKQSIKMKSKHLNKGDLTISGEVAVRRLEDLKLINADQAQTVQQVISLRHAATHHLLPLVPDELMHHLLYFSAKFFRATIDSYFKGHAKDLPTNFLTLSFGDMTTYADKVQRAVSRVRRSKADLELVWLLERGIAFDGGSYLSRSQVEASYKGKKHVMPYLHIGDFLKRVDMVRIVPVEAPKNMTADIRLRKGKPGDSALPVVVKYEDVEERYPYLTLEVADKIGQNTNWVARAMADLKLKGNPAYHTETRSGSKSYTHRYSEEAVQFLLKRLKENPKYNPYAKS